MSRALIRILSASPLLVALLLVGTPRSAHAVPSFARQTGMSCAQCHTAFPELTPFGRAFKANAYNLAMTKQITDTREDRSILEMMAGSPLAAMMQMGYTRTGKSLPSSTPGHADAKNDDIDFPQQLSLFYAGKIAPGLGAFSQVTLNFVDNSFGVDNTDIRYAHTFSPGDKDLIVGLTLNNNPTVSDLWNSTPAWGAPFINSQVAPTPGAVTLINGKLAQQVVGATAYGLWNNLLYAEIGAYHAAPVGIPRPIDATTGATNIIAGFAPYWRAALQKDTEKQSFMIGTYGMMADLYPGGGLDLVGPKDQYRDVAFDAQYQYFGENQSFSAFATWIHENEAAYGSYAAAGLVPSRNNTLDEIRFSGSYLWERLINVRLSWFRVTGRTDTTIYAPAPVSGSQNGSPQSDALQGEASVTPWLNTRFGVQYTHYLMFNGSSTNYDGSGRDAVANDTLYGFIWLAF
jgi:hypothetical protein